MTKRLRYWFATWRWYATRPPMPTLLLVDGDDGWWIDQLYSEWHESTDRWRDAKPTRKDFGL